jgi:hypothetical protein
MEFVVRKRGPKQKGLIEIAMSNETLSPKDSFIRAHNSMRPASECAAEGKEARAGAAGVANESSPRYHGYGATLGARVASIASA